MSRERNKNHPENHRLLRRYVSKLQGLFPEKHYNVDIPVYGWRPGFVLDTEGDFTGHVYGVKVFCRGRAGGFELARPLFDLCAEEGVLVLATEENIPVMTVENIAEIEYRGDRWLRLHTLDLDKGFIPGNPFGIPALPEGLCALFLDGQLVGNDPNYDNRTMMYDGRNLIPYQR